jgi:hypothetical protein
VAKFAAKQLLYQGNQAVQFYIKKKPEDLKSVTFLEMILKN